MNISHKRHEILDIVDWFTEETVLEQMTITFIFAIIVTGICNSYTLDTFSNLFILLSHQQMYMVGHQTVGIESAMRGKNMAIVIMSDYQPIENLEELDVVLIIFKDVLLVDTTKHDMIDACCTL